MLFEAGGKRSTTGGTICFDWKEISSLFLRKIKGKLLFMSRINWNLLVFSNTDWDYESSITMK